MRHKNVVQTVVSFNRSHEVLRFIYHPMQVKILCAIQPTQQFPFFMPIRRVFLLSTDPQVTSEADWTVSHN